MGFVSARSTVQMKGRVACEIHSHEVLLTELIFQNVLSDYTPSEIAALLSCFVFQQVCYNKLIHCLLKFQFTYDGYEISVLIIFMLL